MLGKIEGRSRRGRRKGRWLEGITNAMGLRLDELREIVKGRSRHAAAVGSHRVGRDLETEQRQAWTGVSDWAPSVLPVL